MKTRMFLLGEIAGARSHTHRWLIPILLIVANGTLVAEAADAWNKREFQAPPKTYRPMVRWWVPGGDPRDEELRREIGVLDQAWFGGAELQPFQISLDPNASADSSE